jgi:hypothetical protein
MNLCKSALAGSFVILSLVWPLLPQAAAAETAPAAQGTQDLDFQEYRKFLMSGADSSSNKKLAIQTTCTSSEGEVLRIGEAGYDACLNSVRNAHQQKQITGEKSETVKAPSAGVTIHLGE